MYLYLVRHGQSVGNVLRTFHGQTDYPLTEEGRRQAREAAEKLREVSFTRCCASDLRRAWDTAAACLEGRTVVPEACPALREQDVGEMEDVGWEALEARYPGLPEAYLNDWFRVTPPGGESPEEMADRVGRCVDGIVRRGEDTLIAAHNGSLSLLLIHLGLADSQSVLKPDLIFQQGTYSAVEVTEEGARLLYFNR